MIDPRCFGKQVFAGKREALRALRERKGRHKARRHSRPHRENLEPYRCPVCGEWHLGRAWTV